MPEYLAPGVFIEEISFRETTIEGASTSTAVFLGPRRVGLISGESSPFIKYTESEQIYTGLDGLGFDRQDTTHNYIAQAVRAFFEEGGPRL